MTSGPHLHRKPGGGGARAAKAGRARAGPDPSAAGRAVRMSAGLPRLVLLVLFGLLVVVLARTAWVSDDAYISFRSADNLVNGYGLRWNVAERVQAFTNPLWTLVFAALYVATKDAFAVAIGLSLVLSLAVAGLVSLRWVRDPWAGAAALALLLSSRAFVDYSSSGLENPLIHLLLVTFFLVGRVEPPSRRLLVQSLIAGLAAFNRLDSVVILLPALVWSWWSTPRRFTGLRGVVTGFAPFILWEAFATFYFGSPVPNTAFAKLSTGIPSSELMAQGLRYFANSFATDPLTLLTIACGLAAGLIVRTPARLAAVAGIALHLAYTAKVGGDFMSGRFFASPCLLAVMLLVATPLPRPALVWPAVAVSAIAIGFAAPHPNLTSGRSFGGKRAELVDPNGIADERRVYFVSGGWLNEATGVQKPCSPARADGLLARASAHRLAVAGAIGMAGFFAGPGLYMVDFHALADPFLARLPIVERDPLYATFCAGLIPSRPAADWRIGHFLRALPAGYLATLACGENRITDRRLGELYDRIALVTRGPLTDPRRLREIVRLNLGTYDHFARQGALREWREPDWGEVLACRPDAADALVKQALTGSAQTVKRDLAGLRSALARRPDDPSVLMALGRKLSQVNDPVAAAEAFTRATELIPTHAPAWHCLGVTLAILGDSRRAMAAFREVVRIDPTQDEGFSNLAVLLMNAGRSEEAESLFRRAVSLNDGIAAPWFHLATIRQQRGDLEEATTMLRRALVCEPDNPTVIMGLANALATAGKQAEAAQLFERARRPAPPDTAGPGGR